jgi:hypothetical protein
MVRGKGMKIEEEIKYGDTKLRLIQLESGVRYIQMWSYLSMKWNNLYSDNIEERWNFWKKMEKERNE